MGAETLDEVFRDEWGRLLALLVAQFRRLEDERLRLIFLCAHPVLTPEAAAALTLRLVLGVPTADIAAVFQISPSAMAARLTRAKRTLSRSGERFAVPEGAELPPRLETVCRVVYLAFTVGYAPGSGAEVTRVEVAAEAIRLGRLLRKLLPGRPVLDALLALMLLQHSRRDAGRQHWSDRAAAGSGPVLLASRRDHRGPGGAVAADVQGVDRRRR